MNGLGNNAIPENAQPIKICEMCDINGDTFVLIDWTIIGKCYCPLEWVSINLPLLLGNYYKQSIVYVPLSNLNTIQDKN